MVNSMVQTEGGSARRSAGRFGVAVVALLLVASACGSTHGDGEFGRAALSAPPGSAARQQTVGGSPGALEGAAAPVQADVAGTGSPAAAARVVVPSGAAGGAAPVPNPAASRDSAGNRSAGVTPATRPTATEPTAAPNPNRIGEAAAAPAHAGPKPEIVLGSVGTESGPVGQQLLPLLQGARAWVADVNARGGLNGHPVRLVTGDDGGDPNRAQALARRMIDQDKVTAFYMERLPTTMRVRSMVFE